MTAHPKIDPETGEMLFLSNSPVAPHLTYHVADKTGKLVHSEVIEGPGASVIHDFAFTKNYVVWFDPSLTLNVESGLAFPYAWNERYQAKIGIMQRDRTKGDVQWINMPPFFSFHLRAFVNPVIIHLSTVLLIAMLLMIPTINFGSLSFLLACIGTIGAGYEVTTAVQLWRHHRETSAVNPIDWLWRMCLPVAGYLLFLGTAIGLLTENANHFFNILAVAVILFVLVAIRNTWELMLWIARQQPLRKTEQQ
jgi:hypothetical protein